ncbi:hypothetical protein [Mucilaginibacter gilvus]|uniref:Uncharacterized protein n=1 Tax=Mucilaginibacter gilvus TaxID=2305909 RepID=A0A444MV65_9SPHI|nr:hypothetical protein [Mucilaginibacter gilvus]RWY57524.1 hypothetical protein EPL05_03065 [Mucilaginibacter gilvus]
MKQAKRTKEADFNYWVHNRLGDVAFCYYLNGKAYVKIASFSMVIVGENIAIKPYSYELKVLNPMYTLGISDHLNSGNFTKAESATFNIPPDHTELLLQQFIRVEAKYHPKEIAEPIDLLKLTNGNVFWLQKNKNIVNY